MLIEIQKDVQDELKHVGMRIVVVRTARIDREACLRMITRNPMSDVIEAAHFRLHLELLRASWIVVWQRICETKRLNAVGWHNVARREESAT